MLAYRFEPGFAALSYLLAAFQFSGPSIYSVIVGGSMLVKYLSLRTTSNFWPTFVVFTIYYLARYFTLFEMTVLRTAVALSIAFFVFYSRKDHECCGKHLLLLIISMFFHYSAIIFIPVYLFRSPSRLSVVFAGLACFVAILSARNIALAVLPSYVPVFATYHDFTKATILPKPFAVDILFILFALFMWKNSDSLMRTCVLGMLISVSFHFSLLDYSILASRFRELLSVFFLLYIVRSVSFSNNEIKYITISYAAVSAVLSLYATYIYDPLLV